MRDGLTLALPFDLAFVSALLALVFIDAEHMILPDAITLKGAVLALGARFVVYNLTASARSRPARLPCGRSGPFLCLAQGWEPWSAAARCGSPAGLGSGCAVSRRWGSATLK
ncbi:MAG: hypothetical protein WKF30_00210 [Pyrinomonadaceae bacterium]